MTTHGGFTQMTLAAVLALAGAALLHATPGVQFTSTPLVRSTSVTGIHAMPNHLRIDDKVAPAQVNDVLIQRVFSPAGGSSGWHSHPGYGVVAVKSGIIEKYDADDPTCTPRIYGPGDVFIETPDRVHFVRSMGPADYEAYATFVLPVGAASRMDALNPGNCPF